MNKFLKIIALGIMGVTLVGCSKVPVGNVGIKVYLLGSAKGVSNEEVLGVGRYYIGWNEELYLFPTFTQNYNFDKAGQYDESITFQTSQGLSVNADVGISYSLEPSKIHVLFQNKGSRF